MSVAHVKPKQIPYIFASQSPVKCMPEVRRQGDRIICINYDHFREYRVAVLDELIGGTPEREFQMEMMCIDKLLKLLPNMEQLFMIF